MAIKLYNFLPKKVEEFNPINAKSVGMYTCGPTVYDYVHIGNWRTFVFEDVLKRVLRFNDFDVTHVMNITDIDDKIIKKAADEGVDYKKITEKFEEAFFDDFEKLNIESEEDAPREVRRETNMFEQYPRATESIDAMIVLIQKLLEKGVAYKGDDGIYFSVEKFPNYGKLSGLSKGNLKKGARVNADLYDKESWADFALWKFPSSPKASGGQVKKEPSWPAPFGEGRPGWHIECSAMSMKALGETFDIHAGGVDLLFPHHENEIAQSEAATGKKFVNYWMEGEHLLVEGEKMSKSLNNIYTLADISEKGFDTLALRYLFLTAHYRSKLNFTWESLQGAGNALNNLREEVASWNEVEKEAWEGLPDFEKDFKNAINNDLDMPRAVAVMWDMVKSDNPTVRKHESILVMDKVLGLGLERIKKAELPEGAKELIEKREAVRKTGDFEESDNMRGELAKMGVEVEDTPQGPKWKVKQR
ncbi:MAG: cysteine--tRNA ligase [Candidatus Curtissbacteria bacterium]|nr:cysteine--tRNA ligase [Candidatus Curtissbacteria bacterium]